jgi:membrane protease subunit HflC
MKRNKIALLTGAVLAVIFVCMLFTFQVRQTEVAVVTTFGRFSRSITEPGLQWRLPWPIQKVYEFDNRLQAYEKKFDETITQDQINLVIAVYAGWKIADPRLFLESFNGDLAKAEQTLEPVIRNAKSGVLSKHNFSDLISTNEAELKFDEVEKEMLEAAQRGVKTTYGIAIETLGIKQLGLPESITSTVFERMRAERQRLVARYQSEGDRDAKIIRAEADAKANKIAAEASGQAKKILGEADAKAAEYYETFRKNPELAIFLMQLDALEQSLKERAYLILGSQTPPFNLFNGTTGGAGAVGAGSGSSKK